MILVSRLQNDILQLWARANTRQKEELEEHLKQLVFKLNSELYFAVPE